MEASQTPEDWKWQPSSHIERLRPILESWRGTLHMPGQQCRGVGVDCVRFVCAVYDEFFGLKTSITTLPPDAAMHSREGAIKTMRQIRGLYGPNIEAVKDGTIQPCDAIIIGPVQGGPGHLLIVGCDPNTLWHASREVCTTGLGFLMDGLKIFRVYRKEVVL